MCICVGVWVLCVFVSFTSGSQSFQRNPGSRPRVWREGPAVCPGTPSVMVTLTYHSGSSCIPWCASLVLYSVMCRWIAPEASFILKVTNVVKCWPRDGCFSNWSLITGSEQNRLFCSMRFTSFEKSSNINISDISEEVSWNLKCFCRKKSGKVN